MFAAPTEGSGRPRKLPFVKGFSVAQERTADGRYLIVVHSPTGANNNIWFWRTDGSDNGGEAIDFSKNLETEQALSLSPNERFLAYTSSISGRVEVHVRPFPDGPGRWQISSNGGGAAKWGPDGTELFFYEGNRLMRVSVSTVGKFSATLPGTPLFEHPTLRGVPAAFARYDVSPDGRRFLTVESEYELARPLVRVVQNWLSEFRRAWSAGKND
jgi:hypothetical protein